MTANHTDYLTALAQLRDWPTQLNADLNQSKRAQEHADALAEKAAAAAQNTAAGARCAIETQLAAARTALGPLGKASLVPPRIRPSGESTTATRDDLAAAQQALARAVGDLQDAVRAEINRAEAENERFARQAAQRAQAERDAAARAEAARQRRRRLIRVALAVAAAVAIIVLATVFSLVF